SERERAASLVQERRDRDLAAATDRRVNQIRVASAQLTESLDVESTISAAAEVGTLYLADHFAIDLFDDDGHLHRVSAVVERDPLGALEIDPLAPRGAAWVARSGSEISFPRPSHADLLGLVTDPLEIGRLSSRIGSYLCTPVSMHGRVLGAMTFVR